MKPQHKFFLMGLPMIIFLITEMLLVESTQNIIIFYGVSISTFILLAIKTKDQHLRNYWAVMVLPSVLRIVNLSMPFPILNPKLQLMITYTIIVFCMLLFVNYGNISINFLRIRHHRPLDFIVAIGIGLFLGSAEYLILGSTPLIQSVIFEDAIFVIYIVFMIGFGEELVYRGLLQNIQSEILGPKGALFLSSVLFGIMHLIWRSPLEFLFTTAAGFIFGYQFQRTKSVWLPTLAHAMNNYTWLLVWPIMTGVTRLYLPF